MLIDVSLDGVDICLYDSVLNVFINVGIDVDVVVGIDVEVYVGINVGVNVGLDIGVNDADLELL